MTPLELPSTDQPGSLPLLTELADDLTPEELPTLTEVVDISTSPADEPLDAAVMPDDLPILPESARIADHADAHVHSPEAAGDEPAASLLSEAQLQQLEQQLTRHLETLLRNKLSLRLEQLQKQALDQALGELKAELPMLLRDALSAHLEPR
ncbi:MAG: hypothetical protein HYZ46_00620 [Nitrosomonadales bacterium]|nr:hypothetical protein [Nitrosomonadales bacterium]